MKKLTSEVVVGENAFRYMGKDGRMIVDPSTSGYTLNYSADGVSWTAWDDATPANETLVITDMPTGLYLKLAGNTDTLKVTYNI